MALQPSARHLCEFIMKQPGVHHEGTQAWADEVEHKHGRADVFA